MARHFGVDMKDVSTNNKRTAKSKLFSFCLDETLGNQLWMCQWIKLPIDIQGCTRVCTHCSLQRLGTVECRTKASIVSVVRPLDHRIAGKRLMEARCMASIIIIIIVVIVVIVGVYVALGKL